MSDSNTDPTETIARLLRATNAHDVEGIAACFADDYRLESPIHPARSFQGKEQVRRNWSQIFAAVADLQARLVGSARDGSTVWSEWEMFGTNRAGSTHRMRGVFIFGVEAGLIARGRMFLEPVDPSPTDANQGLLQVLATERSPASGERMP